MLEFGVLNFKNFKFEMTQLETLKFEMFNFEMIKFENSEVGFFNSKFHNSECF